MQEQKEIVKIAEAWINISSTFESNKKFDDDVFFAGYELSELCYSNPETAWIIIKYIIDKTEEKIILSNLAAGPIETLLSAHGSDYINQVEEYARANERFRWTLGGVWQCLMPDDVWERVLNLTADVRDR